MAKMAWRSWLAQAHFFFRIYLFLFVHFIVCVAKKYIHWVKGAANLLNLNVEKI